MKKMSLIAIIATISFVLNSCSSVPTGVTGGYYTSADCQGKPEAIYNSANAIDKIVVYSL